MNLMQAQQQLQGQLSSLYDQREAATITDWVMEKVTGLKKIDRITRNNEPLSVPASELLKKYVSELLAHRPVQYVLEESWFCGLRFYVDENVLIPRPETEELVEWLVEEAASCKLQASSRAPFKILDVGTGSGCIAIALSKKLPDAIVHACDISADALVIAGRNAATHKTPIEFRQLDFLDANQRSSLPSVHSIVSNPPYIPIGEKGGMAPHVVGSEPHLALFVEDEDPLIFYRALAAFAGEKLFPEGALFVEIHEALAAPVMDLFAENGFPTLLLKKDLQGRDRMIKATR